MPMSNIHVIIDELAVKQAELDAQIEERFGMQNQQACFIEKMLALKVELGELANEVRCFKRWSVKPPSLKEVQLEEYADLLHFAISIGNLKHFLIETDTGKRLYTLPPKLEDDYTLTLAFDLVYHIADTFSCYHGYNDYLRLLQEILNLGSKLGFSESDIYSSYFSKYKKNVKRQQESY